MASSEGEAFRATFKALDLVDLLRTKIDLKKSPEHVGNMPRTYSRAHLVNFRLKM